VGPYSGKRHVVSLVRANAREWHGMRSDTGKRHVVRSYSGEWHGMRSDTGKRHVVRSYSGEWHVVSLVRANAREWHVLSAIPDVVIFYCGFGFHC
jgi:hypothetical protein